MDEMLILVDRNDTPLGFDTKARIHQSGALHRAFSIFIFDHQERLLLQRRALGKYHSAGLWSNSCCGHPRQGEELGAAVARRLREEMGFDCELCKVSALTYRAQLPNGLIEHEYDHIYVGMFEGEPVANPDEVADWRWSLCDEVLDLMEHRPHDFTVWFREIMGRATADGLLAQWRAWAGRGTRLGPILFT
ncbi:isopentenyl-diphosphate delta-isomerase [Burkholderia mayonis]|uniref:Isopentenyl-diphosphate Delta-isomerase n=1 Tax=Burkholderia mayonis TaxID=1385591 RepID=A0A1B4FE13_9BURK|nr:isopentenyl-diphosphate Delta-isomerase [Burkholderia mayonis]AOJ01884.1 isopentenyl-diphosphate delta-isomerase [Burkholderia mayonis]KVE47256.1 isopentenyl-diphosphate delta-isomerase [Burkholderia mayonis]